MGTVPSKHNVLGFAWARVAAVVAACGALQCTYDFDRFDPAAAAAQGGAAGQNTSVSDAAAGGPMADQSVGSVDATTGAERRTERRRHDRRRAERVGCSHCRRSLLGRRLRCRVHRHGQELCGYLQRHQRHMRGQLHHAHLQNHVHDDAHHVPVQLQLDLSNVHPQRRVPTERDVHRRRAVMSLRRGQSKLQERR